MMTGDDEVPMTPFQEWRKQKSEFIGMATLHGLRRAGDQTGSVSTPRRYAWALLISLGLTAIIVITLDQIQEYKKHPTSTQTTITYSNGRPLLFPAVTICSLNRFYKYANLTKWDVLQIDAYDLAELIFSNDVQFHVVEKEILKDIVDGFPVSQQDILRSNYQKCQESTFHLSARKKALLSSLKRIRCKKYWKEGKRKHNATLQRSMRSLLDTYGFNMKNSLIDCQFGNRRLRQCSIDDFIPVYSTKYGLCWTFNSARSQRPFWLQTHNGIAGGLRLGIKNPPDVFITRRLNNFRMGTGLKVTLHEPAEPPDVDESGFFVGPGFHSFAQVEKTKEEYVRPPWGKCIHSKPNYTKNEAEHKCYRNLSMKYCGCAPPTYTETISGKFCSPEKLALCMFRVKWNVNASEDSSGDEVLTTEWRNCAKPSACTTNKYKASISGVVWPSVPYMREGKVAKNASIQELRRNYLVLNIYFPEMKYYHVKEVSLIYFTNLLSKFGGTMGLFLGASLLTVMELIELLFLYCRRHVKTTQNTISKWQSLSTPGSTSSLTALNPTR